MTFRSVFSSASSPLLAQTQALSAKPGTCNDFQSRAKTFVETKLNGHSKSRFFDNEHLCSNHLARSDISASKERVKRQFYDPKCSKQLAASSLSLSSYIQNVPPKLVWRRREDAFNSDTTLEVQILSPQMSLIVCLHEACRRSI